MSSSLSPLCPCFYCAKPVGQMTHYQTLISPLSSSRLKVQLIMILNFGQIAHPQLTLYFAAHFIGYLHMFTTDLQISSELLTMMQILRSDKCVIMNKFNFLLICFSENKYAILASEYSESMYPPDLCRKQSISGAEKLLCVVHRQHSKLILNWWFRALFWPYFV